jgi:hypothetical protein
VARYWRNNMSLNDIYNEFYIKIIKERNEKELQGEFSKKQRKKFKKLLKNKINDINEHFDNDGWNIGSNAITEEILNDFFGFDVDQFITMEVITNCDVEWSFDQNARIPEFRYKLPEESAVFCHKEHGEYIVENYDYLKDNDKFEYVGRL